MSSTGKRILRILLLIVGVGVCTYVGLVVFLIGKPSVENYLNRKTFNSDEWKNSSSIEAGSRIKMIDSLLKSHQLIGKTKPEIDSLLGPPTNTGHFREYDYVYWLGPERGTFSIDSEWLAIRFKDNTVTEAKVVSD